MGYKNVCVNCRISLSEGTNYELFNRNKIRNPYCGHESCIYFEFPKNLQEAEAFIRELRKLD
ncbi:MAG: hypothetical protein E6Z90_03110 [Veillonella sp.]|nr:hypothetical protein [Veillonella sp.]